MTKLALTWADRIKFTLTDDLSIKQIKFTDLVLDQHEDTYEDIPSQFDADFHLMTAEFSQFIPFLLGLFNKE